MDAQTVWLEAAIGGRTVGVAGIVKRFAGPGCLGAAPTSYASKHSPPRLEPPSSLAS